MSYTRLLVGGILGFILVIGLLYIDKLKVELKHTKIELTKSKAQISHVLDESKRIAELYVSISYRQRNARFNALQDTLRLEEMSSNHEWFNQPVPEEVQVVLNGGSNE